jgi:dihydroorotate dehydrogenase
MILSLYELAWRPAAESIRRTDPEVAHARTVSLMRLADGLGAATALARALHGATFPERPVRVGGVDLPHPLIVAAGLVKGDGFVDELEALAAVRAGRDIVPGSICLPALVGPVEYGSFTRHPRLGNAGRVLWRDSAAKSLQNRIGLRNPGARAAAAYLGSHAASLPPVWGLNLAVSPGVDDIGQSRREITEAAASFHQAFRGLEASPSWLTLNLSCPNTEDDPRGTRSAELARELASALVEGSSRPVWVKIGPDLSEGRLDGIVDACAESGVRAVVATNTQARPTPDGSALAGMSGAPLRSLALDTVTRLAERIEAAGVRLDIVAGGGILSGADLRAFQAAGARAAMIYTAMVFRGPLAAALILREAERGTHHA